MRPPDEDEQRLPLGEAGRRTARGARARVPQAAGAKTTPSLSWARPFGETGDSPHRDEQRVRARDGVTREARVALEALRDAIHRLHRPGAAGGCEPCALRGVSAIRGGGSDVAAELTPCAPDRAPRSGR